MAISGKPSTLLLVALLGIGIGLAGCGGHDAPKRRSGYPIFSPNGEPLSGGPLGEKSCPEAMGRWFDRVDAGRTGAITRDAFLADARRQFAAMDLDKDGVITPGELGVYRAPFIATAPAELVRAAPKAPRFADIAEPDDDHPVLSGHARGGGRGGETDPAADRPDPVMAADTNLRNQVSLADFMAHAARAFAALDTDRDGRLSRAETLRSCPPER